ncbi:MAG TPA: GFA family protein [Caulobacteraceae bacterium]|nr:GFA family protein [Caulobacteraceae bacterium]
MLEGACHCGQVRWTFDSEPELATACNCTVCRRYGVLWIYGHDGVDVHLSGQTREYVRADGDGHLGFHFCPNCGCVAYWRAHEVKDGRRRAGVNIRMSEPERVADIPIEHLDGLKTWDDVRDGKTVADYWF